MALVFFACWIVWALREVGPVGFLKELFAPKGETTGFMKVLMVVVFFAAGCLEIISILFRPVSLSFRLYGNIFAGENMLETMAKLVPGFGWLLPIPFYFMELLVGLVQALVFMLLTAVFTLLICQHEEAAPAAHTKLNDEFRGLTVFNRGSRREAKKGRQYVHMPCCSGVERKHPRWSGRAGRGIGVGLIGMAASTAVGRNPGAATKILVQSILAIAFAEAIVFYALFLVKYRQTRWRAACARTYDMHYDVILASRRATGRSAQIARTFGVDWPHLVAQIISFCIVCAVLYKFAYRPILAMLESGVEQIAQGLANAEKIKAELDQTEAQRQEVMAQATAQGAKFIEEARAAAARVQQEETKRRLPRPNRSWPRRAKPPRRTTTDARRTQTRGWQVGGASHDHGHRQDSDRGRPAAPGRGNRPNRSRQ